MEKGFIFPWKPLTAPATEFRALCDDEHLYFTFRVQDKDVFVLDERDRVRRARKGRRPIQDVDPDTGEEIAEEVAA